MIWGEKGTKRWAKMCLCYFYQRVEETQCAK